MKRGMKPRARAGPGTVILLWYGRGVRLPPKTRTVAQIRRDLRREEAERERLRWAEGSGQAGTDALNEKDAACRRLEDEITTAEAAETDRRERPVRLAVFWAAVAAIASALAAGGTWWQATHAPPLRVEVTQQPAPAPGPWAPTLGR